MKSNQNSSNGLCATGSISIESPVLGRFYENEPARPWRFARQNRQVSKRDHRIAHFFWAILHVQVWAKLWQVIESRTKGLFIHVRGHHHHLQSHHVRTVDSVVFFAGRASQSWWGTRALCPLPRVSVGNAAVIPKIDSVHHQWRLSW
jgi:hypothetical protein